MYVMNVVLSKERKELLRFLVKMWIKEEEGEEWFRQGTSSRGLTLVALPKDRFIKRQPRTTVQPRGLLWLWS